MKRDIVKDALVYAFSIGLALSAAPAAAQNALVNGTNGMPASLAPKASGGLPPPDPTFTAYSLARLCGRRDDANAQSGCVGAVRGIIHGYQYGVLFVGQHTSMPANTMQRVSLCMNGVPVQTLIDEFVGDANQVDATSLRNTPAEVAVLGSMHMHHACE